MASDIVMEGTVDKQPYLDALFEPEKPDLTKWDVILLSSSGGKDSQTMIREVVRQAEVEGVSCCKLVVVHADLGRVEWPGVVDLAREQAETYGLEFRCVKRRGGDLLEHVRSRGMWPSPKIRYCTSDHKRSVISRVVTALGDEYRERIGSPLKGPRRATFRLLNCLGLRAEESSARRKKPYYAPNGALSNGSRIVYDWHPILYWSEDAVWESIRESGVRYHEAYDLGMPRLSCRFCIFSPREGLILSGKHNPELLREYVELEERIGHTFKPDLSMAEIQDAVERGEEVGEISGKWNM